MPKRTDDELFRHILYQTPVAALISRIREAQTRSHLLEDEVYTRARLYDITVQQWIEFSTALHRLLVCLQQPQAGEVIEEEWLVQRDHHLQHIRRFIEDSPPGKTRA